MIQKGFKQWEQLVASLDAIVHLCGCGDAPRVIVGNLPFFIVFSAAYRRLAFCEGFGARVGRRGEEPLEKADRL